MAELDGPGRRRLEVTGLVTGLLVLMGACSSAPPFQAPAPVDEGSLRERAVTKVEDGIRVSAATPSPEESQAIFGVDLEDRGIEPLWLEIENGSDRLFYFLPTGLDPEYFAPLEVAFLYKGAFAEDGALGEHLQEVAFDHRAPILPGATVSGFVFANRTEPTMMADVDLIGRDWSERIGLVVPLLGTEAAQDRLAALEEWYATTAVVEVDDEDALRSALEALPCCVTDETGIGSGLPLNLMLIGNLEDWGPAFTRRNYRYRPTRPWYAFGREQDVSGRKISRWVAPQPLTLRFWLTPLRYQGRRVWVGQVSSDLGGRFTTVAEPARRTAPDVDEARDDVVQDMVYSQGLAKIGFVEGVGRVDESAPRETPDGSTYHTDGLRAVLVFGEDSVSLAEIDFFDWERLADHRR